MLSNNLHSIGLNALTSVRREIQDPKKNNASNVVNNDTIIPPTSQEENILEPPAPMATTSIERETYTSVHSVINTNQTVQHSPNQESNPGTKITQQLNKIDEKQMFQPHNQFSACAKYDKVALENKGDLIINTSVLIPDPPRDFSIVIKNSLSKAPTKEIEAGGKCLRNSSFQNLSFPRDSNFTGADMSGTDFTGSSFNNAHFYQANLTNVSMINCNVISTDFVRATLDNSSFKGSTFKDCQFQNTDLRKVCMSGATFINVNMAGADLRGVDFREAEAHRLRVKGCQMDKNTKFPKNQELTYSG